MIFVAKIKRLIKEAWYLLLKIEVLLKTFWWKLLGGKTPSVHSIPIIINNFNRLDTLKQLIQSLESRGYRNIIILDNGSTYPPLLDYYQNLPFRVVHLGKNVGYMALWESGIYKEFRRSFYVYTDSDVVIDSQCPDDFMHHFMDILRRYPYCMKVGFGIRIDDLPDHYKEKESVIAWEKQFWKNEVEPDLYKAGIDTTFALYRPYCKGGTSAHFVVRTGFPYVIKHLPWYQDTANLTEEEMYYISHTKKATFWTGRLQ